MSSSETFSLQPIGHIRSELTTRGAAPLQGGEGAPDAWLEVLPPYRDGLRGMKVGDDMIVIAWLDRGRRDVLQLHPRGNPANPLTGVFLTRSPDRPNPLGLHRVKVLRIESSRVLIGPIEALDGTPVVDLKPVIDSRDG